MGGVTSLDHPRAGLPLLEPSGGVNSVFASSSGGRPGRPERPFRGMRCGRFCLRPRLGAAAYSVDAMW